MRSLTVGRTLLFGCLSSATLALGAEAPVPVGTHVRVTFLACDPDRGNDPAVCPTIRQEGQVVSGDDEQLTLQQRSEQYVVSLSSDRLLTLEREMGRSWTRGAGRGARAGALTGLALSAGFLLCAVGVDCGEKAGTALSYAALTIGAATTTGAAIGGLTGGRQWERTDPLPQRFSSGPEIGPASRGAAVSARLCVYSHSPLSR